MARSMSRRLYCLFQARFRMASAMGSSAGANRRGGPRLRRRGPWFPRRSEAALDSLIEFEQRPVLPSRAVLDLVQNTVAGRLIWLGRPVNAAGVRSPGYCLIGAPGKRSRYVFSCSRWIDIPQPQDFVRGPLRFAGFAYIRAALATIRQPALIAPRQLTNDTFLRHLVLGDQNVG